MSAVHYAAHPLPVTLTNTPCRFCQPIPVPSATQNIVLVQSIISINASLSVIGYADNNIEEDFVRPMHKEFLAILHANEGEEKKFTGKQLTFIEDVSSVITGIDIILTDRLLDDVTVSQESAAALSLSLKAIYDSSVPLDDHLRAKGFATALLSILQHAMQIELLKVHLPVEDAENMQRVLGAIAAS